MKIRKYLATDITDITDREKSLLNIFLNDFYPCNSCNPWLKNIGG